MGETIDSAFGLCGRCGRSAAHVPPDAVHCGRCVADLREVGIVPIDQFLPTWLGRAMGWTILVAIVAGVGIGILIEGVPYRRVQQSLEVAPRDAWRGNGPFRSLRIAATGSGFSKQPAVEHVRLFLSDHAGGRSVVWLDAATRQYAVPDARLDPAPQPGPFDRAALLAWMRTLAIDTSLPEVQAAADDVMPLVELACAGTLDYDDAKSMAALERRGGGGGSSGGRGGGPWHARALWAAVGVWLAGLWRLRRLAAA